MKYRSHLAVIVSITLLSAGSLQAAGFEYMQEGSVEGDFSYSETFEFANTSGADFDFNGGAGTDGDANANGGIAAVGGYNWQEAGGSGYALDNSPGGEFATAEFGSASYVGTAGLAGDLAFGDWARMDLDGVAQAGGAGGVGTSISSGYTLDLGASLEGGYEINYEEDLSFNP